MKKWIVLLLVVGCVFAGCSSSSDLFKIPPANTTSKTANVTPTNMTIVPVTETPNWPKLHLLYAYDYSGKLALVAENNTSKFIIITNWTVNSTRDVLCLIKNQTVLLYGNTTIYINHTYIPVMKTIIKCGNNTTSITTKLWYVWEKKKKEELARLIEELKKLEGRK